MPHAANRHRRISYLKLCATSAILAFSALSATAAEQGEKRPLDIRDPNLKAWYELTYDRIPPVPSPESYGKDPKTGEYHAPKATPEPEGEAPFNDQINYWDPESYSLNMKVEAFYPYVVNPAHTWQNIVDMNGRRYMYQYYMRNMKIYDITNPKAVKLLLTRGSDWTKDGPTKPQNAFPEGSLGAGAITIQWSKARGKYILVQGVEVIRFGLLKEKMYEPEKVEAVRNSTDLKGFRVFEMNGPLPDQWVKIAEVTTDYKHPDAPIGKQQGSGVLDIPYWTGGKYMIVAAASDDRQALTEYPNYLHSPGYQIWDMSDPSKPTFVSELTVPGQVVGDKDSEDAYLTNPRAGNRTSWMGARMPIFMPKSIDDGGTIGFAAMGGLGLYTIDLKDPKNPKVLAHVTFPPRVAGTEGDNVDVSQYERTGIVFTNGYPMNDNCYEPYKDIYIIDAKNPEKPKMLGTFPRPKPPANAKFTDYCERRGSFGPKRTGYYTQPGGSRNGIVPYGFYNAGVQLFDVSDPTKPKIAAYYVPKMAQDNVTDHFLRNLTHGVYVEYDRNILWMFTNHGMYALSSPLLGKPSFDMPKTPWPPQK